MGCGEVVIYNYEDRYVFKIAKEIWGKVGSY